MNYTTEQILQFIEDAGEVRVAAALSDRGYLVQKITETPITDEQHRVIGTVRLVDAHGIPCVGMRVKVETRYTGSAVSIDGQAYHVAASDSVRWFQTDALGICAIPFMIGAKVLVHVENVAARAFTVPDASFDILAFPSDDTDAYITPRKPYIPLIRNS